MPSIDDDLFVLTAVRRFVREQYGSDPRFSCDFLVEVPLVGCWVRIGTIDDVLQLMVRETERQTSPRG